MSDATFRVAGASHPGSKRAGNDDWFCLGHFVEQTASLALEFAASSRFLSDYGLLCALADGIGGYARGARAAQVTLEILSAQFYARKHGDLGATALIAQLESDFANVNRVLEATLRREGLEGAGTTLAGMVWLPRSVAVKFWCGDSRILRAGGGYVRALTVDHAPLAGDVARGDLSEAAASQSPLVSKLSRSLGGRGDTRIECQSETWERGDWFLLATDGFHGLGRGLNLVQLRAELERVEGTAPRARVESLVAAAVEADGADNVTLIEIGIV